MNHKIWNMTSLYGANLYTCFITKFSSSKKSTESAILDYFDTQSYPATCDERSRSYWFLFFIFLSFFFFHSESFLKKKKLTEQIAKRTSGLLGKDATIVWKRKKKIDSVRQPGVEPGSTAWEAAMITVTPLSPTWLLSVNLTNLNEWKY